MSLKSYFPEQFEHITGSMISAREVVRCVRIDPEMKPMLTKALARMEDDPEFPHLIVGYAEPFADAKGYFEGLVTLVSNEYTKNARMLVEAGVQFTAPFQDESAPPAPFRFLRYAEALADKLPDHVGSLVFLLDPEEVLDRDGLRRSVRFLCEKTKSPWLKFLLLDSRTDPCIEAPAVEDRRIGFQTFHLSPEEIERRTKEDLNSSEALEPAERRQYLGLLAGFAFARKEYAEAEKLQRQWAEQAEGEGSPQEYGAALYNLGNTLIAQGEATAAVDLYCQVCNLCLNHNLNSLAPLAYTNLGIALHRQGNFRDAFAALKIGRDMFKAQNIRPAEAYVVDCLAQMYAEDGRPEQAKSAWRYALSIYDSLTSSLFKDLREVGRTGILGKLQRLEEQTSEAGSSAAQEVGS